jgi:uncharacterized protein (DUF1697 family)
MIGAFLLCTAAIICPLKRIPMPRFIAFLRAINVGGHVVKMDRLRDLFTELGLTNVQTFIASGNVIFDSSARNSATLERKIEKHLLDALGYQVATFVRSCTELQSICNHRCFAAPELASLTNSLYVAFLRSAPAAASIRQLMQFQTETDHFHVAGRELYWLCRTRFSDSPFSGTILEKTIKMPATVRNATTVRKLTAKHCPDANSK